MNLEHAGREPSPRRRELAQALADLVREADVVDYRDERNRSLQGNRASECAQRLVDEFGVSHEDIRAFLNACGDDMKRTANELEEVVAKEASKSPEARTFRQE